MSAAIDAMLASSSIGDHIIQLDASTQANVERFIAASENALDEDIEHARAEETEAETRRRESDYYRLIRRAFICQANGDFELGNQLQEIMREVDEPLTESEFDSCMARALAAMPTL